MRTAAALLRSLLALAAIVPGLVAGLFVGLFTLDRRRAVNTSLRVWAWLGPLAAGIKFDIEGAAHLESARPAVFVFNHECTIDPLLIVSLLRHDIVGIAKREIRRNPFLGPAFAWAGVVFVDRSGPGRSGGQLDPALAALADGLSVAIAPEGTRSPDGSLGAFKKGAFHLAMRARVPVVPVLLHDSRKLMPRGARLIRPGRVRVTVMAPVATRVWTADSLDSEVDAIERSFRRALTSPIGLDLGCR